MYIGDASNNRIRKVTIATGIISSIAGTGSTGYSGDTGYAISATFSYPLTIAIDSSGIPHPIAIIDDFIHIFTKATYTSVITSITPFAKLPFHRGLLLLWRVTEVLPLVVMVVQRQPPRCTGLSESRLMQQVFVHNIFFLLFILSFFSR